MGGPLKFNVEMPIIIPAIHPAGARAIKEREGE